MTITPWGKAEELRSRQLPPGPGGPRELVARNQRERLFGAMVTVVAERGYQTTRVADLLELSGISRNAFYRHFDNKLDCFMATLDAILDDAMRAVVKAYGRERDIPGDARLKAAFDTMTELVVSQPAAARLCFVEIYAAGPKAIERVDRAAADMERMVSLALRESPDQAGLPDELVRAGLGGLRKIAHTRLRCGDEQELVELGPQLREWALSYRTPPEPLRRPRSPPPPPAGNGAADREDTRTRILEAVTETVAQKGYPGLTITDIARNASISLSTFYAHFPGKEEVVLAALERNTQRSVEATLPAYQQAEDWPHAVGAALHAFLAFLGHEADATQLGDNVYAGGPLMRAQRDQLLTGAQAFLAEGYRQHPEVNAVTGEAIGATINALIYDQLRREGPEQVYEMAPAATFIALAPFIGSAAACAVANESGGHHMAAHAKRS